MCRIPLGAAEAVVAFSVFGLQAASASAVVKARAFQRFRMPPPPHCWREVTGRGMVPSTPNPLEPADARRLDPDRAYRPADRLQPVHDLRLVWPPESRTPSDLADHPHKLGHR